MLWAGIVTTSHATSNVWLDFNANWSLNLAAAANSAGVPFFDATEVAMVEDDITAAMNLAFEDFDVAFFTDDPLGSRERVNFGAVTTATNTLGQTGLDYFNISVSEQAVFAANFGFILEATDSRETQIAEITTALAGTAAHELGHAMGLPHHYAYSDPRITPATYSNTMGFQNQYLMATGPTGLMELGRETTRTFSPWSKLRLESNGLTSNSVSRPEESDVGEVGEDIATAFPLEMQAYQSVNATAGLFRGTINNELDVDYFEITVEETSLFTAELWTGGGFFDSTLTLFDSNADQIAFADDVTFNSSSYDQGGTSGGNAPYLLNIPVEPGTYFLEVAAVGSLIPFADTYDLTTGLFPQLAADFNSDGSLDCGDIDALIQEIASGGASLDFDLNGDGMVDLADRDQWLADAGGQNLSSGNPYIPGDANLDGAVDVTDFNVWNENKFTKTSGWCSGDFNADSSADVSDFNIWNQHRFTAADSLRSVPEPTSAVLTLFGVAFLAAGVRRHAL